MSRLVVNPGTPQAWEITLKPGPNSLGRSEANDFQINDSSVSSAHCEIYASDGAASLRDLGSTNGTFIDGARIQEQPLSDGQPFRLGNVEFIFHAAAATDAAPQPPPPPTARIRIATPALTPPPPATSYPSAPTPPRAPAAPPKSFYKKLPGAFVYPFRGAGVIVLICAVIALGALNFVGFGIFGLVIMVCLYGFIFLFMQHIILSTVHDESDELSFPEATGLGDACGQLVGTVLASFWIAIALVIAKFSGTDIPAAAIMGAVIVGGIYFPMALLAVAMKDTVAAANPLVVVPAMMKAPMEYAVTVILLLAVFGVRQLGDLISGGAGHLAMRTHSESAFIELIALKAVWAFLSVYLLAVTMRLLGLFYNGAKKKLGWFKF